MNQIRDSKGNLHKSTSAILGQISKFYTDLYHSEPTSPMAREKEVSKITTQLREEEKEHISGLLTAQEVTTAVKEMKTGKSPGLDGLTLEFYREFWAILKQDFLEMANEGFTRGKLSHSQRTGVIRLIYKKGNREDLTNWRPITLLNADYKIIAKTLANRLKEVLPSIVDMDQTCYIRTLHRRQLCSGERCYLLL